tara:strand:+ start:225 stop:452 length:228 start_codon:yes stop_codon:yes gene_type:complete
MTVCNDVDLHSNNQTNDDHGNESHHCHIGHTHTLVLSRSSETLVPNIYIEYQTFPRVHLGEISNFVLEIIRPPIA